MFELRLTIEGMERAGLEVSEIRNGGGGSHSDFWMRLKATVLNKPIWLPEVRDSSCLGAALLAAVGSGMFAHCSSAATAMVRMERRYEPESAVVSAYDARYEEYRVIREILDSEECTLTWQPERGWEMNDEHGGEPGEFVMIERGVEDPGRFWITIRGRGGMAAGAVIRLGRILNSSDRRTLIGTLGHGGLRGPIEGEGPAKDLAAMFGRLSLVGLDTVIISSGNAARKCSRVSRVEMGRA